MLKSQVDTIEYLTDSQLFSMKNISCYAVLMLAHVNDMLIVVCCLLSVTAPSNGTLTSQQGI